MSARQLRSAANRSLAPQSRPKPDGQWLALALALAGGFFFAGGVFLSAINQAMTSGVKQIIKPIGIVKMLQNWS